MFPPEPKFKKEAVGDPLFLTPLLEEGRWREARYVHIQIAFFQIKQENRFYKHLPYESYTSKSKGLLIVFFSKSIGEKMNLVCDVTDISQIGQSTVKTYHECDLSGSEHTTWVRQAARVGPGLGFGPDLVSYAGFITARHPQFNSHLYFWFFPSQADPSNDPIILWLQVKQFRNIYPLLESKPTFFGKPVP